MSIAKIMEVSQELNALGQTQEAKRLRHMVGRLNKVMLAAVTVAPAPVAPAPVAPAPVAPAPVAPAPVAEFDRVEGRRFHRTAPWETRLQENERILLAYNERRGPMGPELDAGSYFVRKDEQGRVKGFLDRESSILYASPSALCKAKMHRDGGTNDWDGPSHCFVQREGRWVNLKDVQTVLAVAQQENREQPQPKPLEAMTGQELRDTWAALTGRPMGLRSSGNFHNKRLLIQEITRLRQNTA
jgi:hypothetical protein